MSTLSPLRFRPILREYLWGGRRLAKLGKPLGDAEHYAESWEVVDHGADQSTVAEGPLAGTTLHALVRTRGAELLGRHDPQRQFPLLFKYLDCHKTLSVQVHPDDAQAAQLDPPDLGKTEAWIVLAAEPGSRVYSGLKTGVTRESLERQLAAGDVAECLHQFEPQVGDCILIEAGTVHALGEGLLIAEIQQASDTTFRLFDWNRVDRDGKPRALHVRESLETTDFQRGPVGPVVPTPTDTPNVERLVACDKFIVDRWRISEPAPLRVDDRFHILAGIESATTVTCGGYSATLHRGDSLLVPACSNDVTLVPGNASVILDMYLP